MVKFIIIVILDTFFSFLRKLDPRVTKYGLIFPTTVVWFVYAEVLKPIVFKLYGIITFNETIKKCIFYIFFSFKSFLKNLLAFLKRLYIFFF